MKSEITVVKRNGKEKRKKTGHIPFRYVFTLLLMFLEIVAVIAAVVILVLFVPYSYITVVLVQVGVAISIIASNDNPDYKVPWLFFVLLIPIVGFMFYFMLYSRKLSKRQQKAIARIRAGRVVKDDEEELSALAKEDSAAYSQAMILKNLSDTHIYRNTAVKYFSLGDDMYPAFLRDLAAAEEFIFLEYFIIEGGRFWSDVLGILKEKAAKGVEVRVVYDDIGCMRTLPDGYEKTLLSYGIKCAAFGKIKGQSTNKLNNRNHRKIAVIDGKVGYTGGLNIADEYINRVQRFGHWKDVAIRLEGEGVNELTRLFLIDYIISARKLEENYPYYNYHAVQAEGYCIPFGDGPRPIYDRNVAKIALLNLLGQAEKYVYITTPYLIIDNELASALENAAIRGVDVRIITPHIPDKKLVFTMTRSYYTRLMQSGVRIYEYEPGFIHAKTYLADGKMAIIGTINLDYRSLVHHFENGVWLYGMQAVKDMENDFNEVLSQSIEFDCTMLKQNAFQRFVRSLVKIFAPLL